MFNDLLNSERDDVVFRESGREFQSAVVRGKKEFLYSSVLAGGICLS